MNDLSRKEQESIVMVELLKALKSLGGQASRKQVKKEMKESSSVVTEEYIDQTKVSKRSGNAYKPFDFVYNFSIKTLEFAGYLELHNKNLVLTEKAWDTEEEKLDIDEDVRKIAEPIWQSKSKRNAEKSKRIEKDEELAEVGEWKEELLSALKQMTPQRFERFSRGLLNNMGVELDSSVGINFVADGGLDGFGYITSEDFRTTRVALQAKRWEGKVSSPEIDKFRGAMDKYNAEYGIFITTSDFTKDAIKVSRRGTRVITLINGEDICDLVAKYEYYVKPVITYELDTFYYEDKND